MAGVDDSWGARFAETWVHAWNARDVEAVLAHMHDDVCFTSPVAAVVVPQSRGVIESKAALREYWTTALSRNQDLHFELLGTFIGVGTLVIHYRDQQGRERCEVYEFEDDLVVRGHAASRSVG